VKITNEPLPSDFRPEKTSTKQGAKNAESAYEAGLPQDTVEMSEAAKLAAKLHDDGTARVEQLRAQFRSGNYTVDAGKVSAKLVDSHLSE
jgi:flagellar biosynthesis anti-sigma factor FlgM